MRILGAMAAAFLGSLLAVQAAAAPVIDWNKNAFQLGLRGRTGKTFAFTCPPSRPSGYVVWGTDDYTDDSPICPAALHAGVITWQGGSGVLVIAPDRGRYAGSVRNGLESRDFGSWRGSYHFEGGGRRGPDGGDHSSNAVEDPVADVTWRVCAYPNADEGCGDWRFDRNGAVEGLANGRVVWTGRWTRLEHYVYRFDFDYLGSAQHQWVRFSDETGGGRATVLMGYPGADMTSPNRKGHL